MTGESGSKLSDRMCITIMNDVYDTTRYSMSIYLGTVYAFQQFVCTVQLLLMLKIQCDMVSLYIGRLVKLLRRLYVQYNNERC